MKVEERFIRDVLETVPSSRQRAQIEMDLRAHLAERVDHGQSIEDAVRHFGDPDELAESYLASIPLESASFPRRTLAKLLDFLLLGIAVGMLMTIVWQTLGPSGIPFFPGIFGTENPLIVVACVLIFVGLVPGYFVASEFKTGQTFGKRVLGMRVVRESGARIGLAQSFVRQIPLVGEFFLIDALFALFTEKNQRAFELITRTRTVLVEEEDAR